MPKKSRSQKNTQGHVFLKLAVLDKGEVTMPPMPYKTIINLIDYMETENLQSISKEDYYAGMQRLVDDVPGIKEHPDVSRQQAFVGSLWYGVLAHPYGGANVRRDVRRSIRDRRPIICVTWWVKDDLDDHEAISVAGSFMPEQTFRAKLGELALDAAVPAGCA